MKVFNVLFFCAENSARSIVAEAVLRHWGKDRFRAFSAGIKPAGEVDPLAMELLKSANLATDGLKSKDVQEFNAAGAPEMDFVISLCDTPAASLRDALPGNPTLAHWTITDPATSKENVVKKRASFHRAFQELENRVRLFVLLRHEASASRQPPAQQAQAM